MRKLMKSFALASAVAIAGPASAQPQQPYSYLQQGPQIQQRLYRLRDRIQRVAQRGAVSRQESDRLQREFVRIERRYDQFARNGINRQEQYELQRRIEDLQAQVGEDRQDGRRYRDIDRGYQDDGLYKDGRHNDGRHNDDRHHDRRNRDDD